MSHEQLADAVGVSRAAIYQWESGEVKNLKTENLFALAHALRVSLEELVFDASPAAQDVAEESGTYRVLPEASLRAANILGQLPKEIRFDIQRLIDTLAPLTNESYWKWVQQQEERVAARGQRKATKAKQ